MQQEQKIYPWGDSRRFNSYANYFRHHFGGRIQKVTINAGFTCPNRDGTCGTGGCTFCNNEAFTPSYCTAQKSVIQQIEEGVQFHANRYRMADSFLAYFQSFSNTHASLEHLRKVYDQAFEYPGVVGVVIGTRPDCIDERKLDYFAELASRHYVAIEYGVESCYDATLRSINRGHDFQTAVKAIEATAQRGIATGAHFILGLPGESDNMLIEQTERINALPLTTIKFHQLQIFKGTAMAKQYASTPEMFRFWEKEEYIDLFIEILQRLRSDLVVERFASEAPPRFHCGKNWGMIRNDQLIAMLEKRLAQLDTFQGALL